MTDAELLADVARALIPARQSIAVIEGLDERSCAVFALALRLAKRPDLVLRAVVEDWPRDRIVRELY